MACSSSSQKIAYPSYHLILIHMHISEHRFHGSKRRTCLFDFGGVWLEVKVIGMLKLYDTTRTVKRSCSC